MTQPQTTTYQRKKAAMKQTPMIVESTLTKPSRWFVLTRYVEKRGVNPRTGDEVAYLKAIVKHDVTDQMRAILKRRRG